MHITELTVTNYRQHKHRSLLLHGRTIVGLIGQNGTGKSALLEALGFALGLLPDTLEDLMSWAAKESPTTTTTVFLSGTHLGRDIQITRTLNRSKSGKVESKAVLVVDGGTPINGATAVNTYITTELQLDRDLVGNTMIVSQGALTDTLFAKPTARTESWMRLCGIAHCRTIYDKLGPILSGLPEIKDLDIAITSLQGDIDRTEEQLTTLRAQLAEMPQPGAGVDTTIVRLVADCKYASEQLVAARGREEAATRAYIEVATADQAALRAEAAKLQESSDMLRNANSARAAQRNSVRQHNARCAEHAAATRDLESARIAVAPARAQVDAVSELRATLEYQRAEIKAIDTALAGIASEIRSTGMLHATAKETAKTGCSSCPLCSSALADGGLSLLSTLEEKLAGLNSEQREGTSLLNERARDLSAAEAKIAAADRALSTASATVERAEARARSAAAALGGDAPTQRDDAALAAEQAAAEAEIAAITGSIRQLLEQASKIDAAATARDNAARAVVEARLREAEITRRVAELVPGGLAVAGDLAANAAALNQARDAAAAARGKVEGEIAQASRWLENACTTLVGYRNSRAANAAEQERRNDLEAVRKWLHPSQGPTAVVQSVLQIMTGQVNAFLDQFDALYRVVDDPEQMSFKYYYLDGRPVGSDGSGSAPVSKLSGGEKMVMAMAFRFASYCVFARNTGLLVLDEPTVYLDEASVNKFCQVLPRLRQSASQIGLQLLIATHEKTALPFFDASVDLGEK